MHILDLIHSFIHHCVLPNQSTLPVRDPIIAQIISEVLEDEFSGPEVFDNIQNSGISVQSYLKSLLAQVVEIIRSSDEEGLT